MIGAGLDVLAAFSQMESSDGKFRAQVLDSNYQPSLVASPQQVVWP